MSKAVSVSWESRLDAVTKKTSPPDGVPSTNADSRLDVPGVSNETQPPVVVAQFPIPEGSYS